MSEEQVTKAIMSWLINRNWHILCFDFPQSGTGRVFHYNDSTEEKNKNAIIPDIVAIKNHIAVFFENKNRFYYPDYIKINNLIIDNKYTNDIDDFLSAYNIEKVYYGIGLPVLKHKNKSKESAKLVDFILGVEENKTVKELYNPKEIIF